MQSYVLIDRVISTLLSQVYALCILIAMPAAIFSAPLEVVGEIAGNGIDDNGAAEDEIILSVSTIVNGVKKSEAVAIVAELGRLGEDIKAAAFEAFMLEVTQKAMTVEEVKEAVEAVKVGERERGGQTVRTSVTYNDGLKKWAPGCENIS